MKLSTKARLSNLLRKMKDICTLENFAIERDSVPELKYMIELSQPFKPSSTLEGKIHNLKEAAGRINAVTIFPGEIFSFWRIVGNPNNPRRFKYGRSIRAGKVTRDCGGGLCQASGIIHHASLLMGLEIVERYSHSVDLYTEETRFAPLGTDATVFFGFKDLRIRNTLPFPIRFHLEVESEQLRVIGMASQGISVNRLNFEIFENADGIKTVVVSNQNGVTVSKSVYKPLK